MLTKCREWQDLLYTLGLFGKDWLYVDSVADAYLTWKTTDEASKPNWAEDAGAMTEEKLRESLAAPPANLPPVHVQLIVNILHHLLRPEDVPMPPLPKIN
jgi:hypothetical protein